MDLHWGDAQTIAQRLFDADPELDPTRLRLTELHAMVCALPDFRDDPQASNEARLEAILAAWLEERD